MLCLLPQHNQYKVLTHFFFLFAQTNIKADKAAADKIILNQCQGHIKAINSSIHQMQSLSQEQGQSHTDVIYSIVCKSSVWDLYSWLRSLRKKATVHQVTTMLVTSKDVLFPGVTTC